MADVRELIVDLEWTIAPGRIVITSATADEFSFVILPDGGENGKQAPERQPDEVPLA